jgi:hypothetical protein
MVDHDVRVSVFRGVFAEIYANLLEVLKALGSLMADSVRTSCGTTLALVL